MKKIIIYLSIVLYFVIPINNIHANNIDIQSSRWKVELVDISSCENCPTKQSFRFSVVDLEKNESFEMILKNYTRKVKFLHLYNSRFIIVGELPYLGDIVTCYSLQDQKIIDEFYCYAFSVSSNGRYAIFKKYYPRFTPMEFRTDVVLVYDFSKSPRENRVQRGRECIDHENSGIPIFPMYNAKNKIGVPNYGIDNFLVYQPIAWSKKGDKVAFIAKDTTHEKLIAILAVFPERVGTINVFEKGIEQEKSVKRKNFKYKRKIEIIPERIEVNEKGMIKVITCERLGVKAKFELDLPSHYDNRFTIAP